MDNITQGILGAWIAGVILSENHRTRSAPLNNAMLRTAAVITNIPDFDVLIGPFIPRSSYIDQFLFHRGLSHSLFFNILVALIIGLVAARIDKAKRPRRRRSLAIYASVLVGHLLVDTMTSYGTRLLLPFSDLTLALDTIFVVDFFLTIPLLLLFLVTLFVRGTVKKRQWVRGGLAFACLYLFGTFIAQSYVKQTCSQALISQDISYERMLVQPEPLQPFLRRCLAENRGSNGEVRFLEEYYSLFDTTHQPRTGETIRAYHQNTSLVTGMSGNDRRRLQSYTQGRRRATEVTHPVTQLTGTVIDGMKFSGMLGWQTSNERNIMFGFLRDPASKSFKRYSGSGRTINKSTRQAFWERVRGI